VPESDVVAADARAIPVRNAELAAPAGGGVVAEVLVEEGERVTAGQPLLRLDGARLEAQLVAAASAASAGEANVRQAEAASRQAAAQVTVAIAGVDQAQAGVDAADATRDGTPSGTAARRAANAEVERAQAAVRSARAQLAAARRAVEAAAAAVEAAAAERDRADAAQVEVQVALDELSLEAPIGGIIASLDAVAGETVTTGSAIVRIADTSGWRFETIDLDEAAIGRLAEGAEATITVDAFPDVEIAARVVSISPFGESSAGDIVYTVTLEPTGDVPDGLRWNMTASAQIDAIP
jgi:multidrug resistance efflux pump